MIKIIFSKNALEISALTIEKASFKLKKKFRYIGLLRTALFKFPILERSLMYCNKIIVNM